MSVGHRRSRHEWGMRGAARGGWAWGSRGEHLRGGGHKDTERGINRRKGGRFPDVAT